MDHHLSHDKGNRKVSKQDMFFVSGHHFHLLAFGEGGGVKWKGGAAEAAPLPLVANTKSVGRRRQSNPNEMSTVPVSPQEIPTPIQWPAKVQ